VLGTATKNHSSDHFACLAISELPRHHKNGSYKCGETEIGNIIQGRKGWYSKRHSATRCKLIYSNKTYRPRKTRQAMYVQRYIKVQLRDHCCCVTTIWLNSSQNEKCVRQKLYRKSEYIFYVQKPFPENRVVYEKMWKSLTQPRQPTDVNTAHVLCMLDNQGYKHTENT
jgi:hypothetical protein